MASMHHSNLCSIGQPYELLRWWQRVTDISDAVDFFDMVGQTEWNRDLQRTLIHWIGLRDDDDVLDIGCGAGHFATRVAQRTKHVTGVDVSPAMVKRAELNAEDLRLDNVTFVTGNVKHLPFSNNKFNVITCLSLLFMFDDKVGPLVEILKCLQPSGQAILLNPGAQMNPWAVETYCQRHNLRDFERDSLLSWATAAARYGTMDEVGMARLAEQAHGRVTDSLTLLDGMVFVSKIQGSVESC